MTDEYLDRSSLVARMKYYEEHTTEGSGEHYAYSTALREIRNAPAADVAPVVRCKDCQHFKHYGKTSLFADGKNIKAGWCNRRVRYDEEYRMPSDGFCSYGRRMDGGNENG